MRLASMQIISAPGASERSNEDVYFTWQDDQYLTLAVMDGVTQLLDYPSLAEVTRLGDATLTPGLYAAQVVRNTLARDHSHFPRQIDYEFRFYHANDAIRERITQVYGAFSVEAIVAREPRLAPFAVDPRYIRLLLPSTVATLVDIDLRRGYLECEHIGDTALVAYFDDGDAIHITAQPRTPLDDPAYATLRDLVLDPALFVAAFAQHDPRMLITDMAGRFWHNYVDAAGTPQPQHGVGAVDGLTALEAGYIAVHALDLGPVTDVLLCSDGFIWPRLAGESDAARWRRMRALIQAEGMRGYLRQLRAWEADRVGDLLIPPLKIHDDATAIWIQLEA